jgi:hypothetical protein
LVTFLLLAKTILFALCLAAQAILLPLRLIDLAHLVALDSIRLITQGGLDAHQALRVSRNAGAAILVKLAKVGEEACLSRVLGTEPGQGASRIQDPASDLVADDLIAPSPRLIGQVVVDVACYGEIIGTGCSR